MSAYRYLILSALAALLSGLAFTPGLPGQFIFDDAPNITANNAVHLTELSLSALADVLAAPQLSGTTRALPTLSLALDYWRAGGPDPFAFKITNIVLHSLTTLILALFLKSLLLFAEVRPSRAPWAALALASAWALHPLQVSAVLYAIQRIQTMGTFFLVLALWTYLCARRAQIQGRSGRAGLLCTGLLWILAIGCKEDSALLPAYTLALELTVLRFAAANHSLARRLRLGYLVAVIVAAFLYFCVALPHYWDGAAYYGRDFSPGERLLTQPRMLCMYLWQIVAPLPSHMPFYYDWVQPSRSLLQPWTTLPAIAFVIALIVLAWRLRVRIPLFAFGVFVFFSAHVITSNVVGLELAFEHRNHFALIGAVLATGTLLAAGAQHVGIIAARRAGAFALILLILAGATLLRAGQWATTEEIARLAAVHAPGSSRAWTQLCAAQFSAGGGALGDNPRLDEAIETCEKGVASSPQSATSSALLIVLKSLRGDIVPADWLAFQERLKQVPMTRDNVRVFMTLTFHSRKGVHLDRSQLLSTFDILKERGRLGAYYLAAIGYFVLQDMDQPDAALPYFLEAIAKSPNGDPFPRLLGTELREIGRADLARLVEGAGSARDATLTRAR